MIIGDASGNHDQDSQRFNQLLHAIETTKCVHALKYQMYIPKDFCKPGDKFGDGPWKGHDMWECYSGWRFPTPWIWPMQKSLSKHGIISFPSVFSKERLAFFLEFAQSGLDKIVKFSARYRNKDMIRMAAKAGFEIIYSDADDDYDIHEIVKFNEELLELGCPKLAVLVCQSEYPAMSNFPWKKLEFYQQAMNLGVEVGISCHSPEILNARKAIKEFGVKYVERHIWLDNACVDGEFVSTPEEFSNLMKLWRKTHNDK